MANKKENASKWSFGERIPVIENERERTDPSSIGAAFVRLATLLSHRLDWSAIAEKASAAELVGTQVELAAAREAVKDAQAATDEIQKALAQTKTRTRRILILASVSLIIVCLSFLMYHSFYSRNALTDPDPSVRRRALSDMEKSGTSGAKFAPEVAALLKDPDPSVRRTAVRVLEQIGEAGAKFAPEVATLLKDPDPSVRRSAVEALGKMGEAGAKFAPEVAALLKDPDRDVDVSAAQALHNMGTSGAKYLPKQ